MPVLYFSGGIDSATLAFDLAKHPYRYGITGLRSASLFLLTVVSDAKEVATKKRQLKPLLDALNKVTLFPIIHEVRVDGLQAAHRNHTPIGGSQSLNLAVTGYAPDIATTHYTAGWILWMAGVAVNILELNPTQDYGPELAFLGHQWNGPVWEKIEKTGALGDAVPEFYRRLNHTIRQSGSNVELRAPFLDNRMNRAQVVQLALEIGVPLRHTSTCREGWMRNCGACGPCLLRHAAFKTLGVKG